MDFITLCSILEKTNIEKTANKKKESFVAQLQKFILWPQKTQAEKLSYLEYQDWIFNGSISPAAQMISSIYLLQGRLKEAYLENTKKYPPMAQVEAKILSISAINNNATPYDVYRTLSMNMDDIVLWVTGKSECPDQFFKLLKTIQEPNARKQLASILSGNKYPDEWIIRYLGTHPSSGRGAEKIIGKTYSHTWPDLGWIFYILWRNPISGFMDIGTAIPEYGLPVPPQSINHLIQDEAYKKFQGCYLEGKTNGWQAQIHKSNDAVVIFDREFMNITHQVPTLVADLHEFFLQDFILEGEILGLDDNEGIVSFADTFRVKDHKIEVFDILKFEDKDLRHTPYYQRRNMLLEVVDKKATRIRKVQDIKADTIEDFDNFNSKCESDPDIEGMIIKKPDAHYLSGRTSDGRWKYKPTISLDVVIIGYRLSNKGTPTFLISVWDKNRTSLIPIGEAIGSQVKKEIWESILDKCEVTEKKSDLIAASIIPKYWVEPKIAIEIITQDKRVFDERFFNAGNSKLVHSGKFFPRDDKSLISANTIEYFLSLKLEPGNKI